MNHKNFDSLLLFLFKWILIFITPLGGHVFYWRFTDSLLIVMNVQDGVTIPLDCREGVMKAHYLKEAFQISHATIDELL